MKTPESNSGPAFARPLSVDLRGGKRNAASVDD
jgi:hypothetical protein